jgi:hypothetical protein
MRRSPGTVWRRLPDDLKRQVIGDLTDIYKEICHE